MIHVEITIKKDATPSEPYAQTVGLSVEDCLELQRIFNVLAKENVPVKYAPEEAEEE